MKGKTARPLRKKQARAAPPQKANDALELLLNRTLSNAPQRGATGLHTILYDMTPSLRDLAYKYGFSIGRMVQQRGGSVEELMLLLERAGMGSPLYLPSEEVSHIRSTRTSNTFVSSHPVHYFESGIISGYFSAHNGRQINTIETSCVLNGDQYCNFFSAENVVPEPYAKGRQEPISNSLNSCAQSLKKEDNPDLYTILAIQPLLKPAIRKATSHLIFLAFEKIHESTKREEREERLNQISSLFGIKFKVESNTKAKKSFLLTYTLYNSAKPYVDLTLPAFVGFMNPAFERESIKSRAERNGAYSVRISFRKR